MADFTDLDDEKLEELRKALLKSASTTTTRAPWQEHFGRETSSPSAKAVLASDIIRGFSGSWAASYNYGYGAGITANTENEEKADTEETPIPIRAKTTKLGLRGVPDVDFVPYNWRTNRFGSKGPSLVGHPISYEVVGPTLKSPFCDWTWEVQPNAGPNGGDTLTMSIRVDGGAAVSATIADGYGPDIPAFTIGDSNEPNGGLYVLITDDGANANSVPALATPMGALAGYLDTAKYEIFRVASVAGAVIELHPNKPLANYFDLTAPLPRSIRAITVIRPYVTRLAAVPGSGPGVGQERVFVVVSPEVSASSDLYPPYDGTAGSWLQGDFDVNPGETPSGRIGSSFAYMGRQNLPIPHPLRKGVVQIETAAGATPTREVGLTYFPDDPATPTPATPADIDKILRLYDIQSEDNTALTWGTPAAALGWFPIIDITPGPGFVVTRTAEVNPENGHIYFGPGPYLQDAVSHRHTLLYTLHEEVSELWEGAFNIDWVEACRLRNIIDPHDVARFEKQAVGGIGGVAIEPGGASFSGPDKAIWDTSYRSVSLGLDEPSNPGSLLDLGFRMVLFPAKDDGSGNPIPDFDKPIQSRGYITIDPSIDEDQFVEIDYSAGVVRLSHPPPVITNGGVGDIIPNKIIGGAGTTNSRNEVVLFAACVPYSMEESQIGTGSRIVGRSLDGEDRDVLSDRVIANIDLNNTNGIGVPPFVGTSAIAPTPVEVVLDRIWEGPNTGVFEITDATGGTSTGASFGLWGYTENRTVLVGGKNVTALGGITSLPTTITDPSLSGIEPRGIVLRREVTFAERSPGKDFGVDNATNDTFYGSSARGRTVRFENSAVRRELDGSIVVSPLLGPKTVDWVGMITASSDVIVNGSDVYRLSQNGVFEDVIYEDNTAEAGGVPRAKLAHGSEGLFNYFPASGLGNYSGFLTKASRVRLDQICRLVYKFGFQQELAGVPPHLMTSFIGLGTGELIIVGEGINNALVNIVTSGLPPPATNANYAGLYIDGVVGPPGPPATFHWFVGNLSTASYSSIDTGVAPEDHGSPPVLYLVIETARVDPVLKMALFDSELNRLSEIILPTTTLGVPSITAPMEVIGGVLDSGGSGATFGLSIYWISYTNRIDLPSPVF